MEYKFKAVGNRAGRLKELIISDTEDDYLTIKIVLRHKKLGLSVNAITIKKKSFPYELVKRKRKFPEKRSYVPLIKKVFSDF